MATQTAISKKEISQAIIAKKDELTKWQNHMTTLVTQLPPVHPGAIDNLAIFIARLEDKIDMLEKLLREADF